MAEAKPFSALRYDTGQAGPLEDLVAPPYDVIGPAEREQFLSRSPYNVVHLTLPDSEEEAGQSLRSWRENGILAIEEPAFWALSQDYVGPDGGARTRTGLVVSLGIEPYENGSVLPHERTHRGPKEGRLRLLRATQTQLEPIFLLYEGQAPFAVPDHHPELEVEGARLWRLEDEGIGDAFADRRLLIADGHHRYETALAYHEEVGTPASGSMMVVLVSLEDPGLTIFPTHRVFREPPPELCGRRRRGGRRGAHAPDPDRGRLRGRGARRDDAAEEHVLLSEARLGAALPPPRRVSPWLELCRAAVGDVQLVLDGMPSRKEREPVVGAGKGGDDTTAVDAAAEAAILKRLERLHADEGIDFHLVSEELGERTYGLSPTTHVVVDPIDGSLNAKRNIPFFSVSIAVAEGPTMKDVVFGFVHDFGSGEEWTARRGEGAWLNGERLGSVPPKEKIEVLALEATVAASIADKAVALAPLAHRLRVMGSLALSLCYLAAGRVDAVCSLKEARAVDIAAAQLLLHEVGLPIIFVDAGPFGEGPLDTAARSPVAAAATQELCEQLAHIVAT